MIYEDWEIEEQQEAMQDAEDEAEMEYQILKDEQAQAEWEASHEEPPEEYY